MKPIRDALEQGGSKERGHGIKRAIAMALLTMGLAGVARPAAATPAVGLTNTLLARGTDVSDGTLPIQIGSDVVMAQITVEGGGSSGWHSHPGGAIIIVKTGRVTVYRAIGSQCQQSTYEEGQAFIERPGELDLVVDATATQTGYELFVTFPRVPMGDKARDDDPDPGTCPGL